MIAHHRLIGDTSQPEVWQRLEAIRSRIYTHAGGAPMRILSTCVDSGYRKNEVYTYVASVQQLGVHAVKGDDGSKRNPVARSKSKNRSGVKLVIVGVDSMKDTLFARLKKENLGPGFMHFRAMDPDWHNGADAEYFAQFARERKQRRRIGNRYVDEYVKTGANEAVDLEVYNLAALHVLGPAVRSGLDAYVQQARKEGEELQAKRVTAQQRSAAGRGAVPRRGSWATNF